MTDDSYAVAYDEFLRSKEPRAQEYGFDVAEDAVNPTLFPFQRAIVRWALRRGRAAIFAGTGLGKTFMQVEWARLVVDRFSLPPERPRVLILAPLAVGPPTIREAARLGVVVTQVREQAEVGDAGVYVTNYEMLDKFDPAQFVGVVLDESSILKSFMGKTKQALLAAFRTTRFKLACTATPAPNDHLELGNHSDFLGVMEGTEMLSRWFVNDPMQAGHYRLKGHAAAAFWSWVHSWAVSCELPSDLGGGFSDDGYVLPGLEMSEHVVTADATTDVPDGHLFRTGGISATSIHKEARLTTDQRAAEVAAIIAADAGERWIVWCNTDYEADALLAAIPGAVEVRGSHPTDFKEDAVRWFTATCECESARLPGTAQRKRRAARSAPTTCDAGSPGTGNTSASTGGGQPTDGTPRGERSTHGTSGDGSRRDETRSDGSERTPTSGSASGSGLSASPSSGSAPCSRGNGDSARSAEPRPPVSGSASIIATGPALSGDSYADRATTGSAASATTRGDSTAPRCTCGGRRPLPGVLISKPRIFGMGLNFQGCARMAFVGLSYSYEQLYQAIRRCHRFGQARTVQVHIVRADTEGQVLATILEKQGRHEEMKREMNAAMRREQLRDAGALTLVRTPPALFASGDGWELWRGDCVDVARAIPDRTVGLSVTSPPFSNLYIYSDAAEDMGNSADDEEFLRHYSFLIRELRRATIPGRIAAVHCKDLPRYQARDGSAGLRDFPGAIIRAFEAEGWTFHSRVTIWKCPVTEMQRTKNSGLLYKNLRADSSCSRQGMADYLLAFRRWDGLEDGMRGPEPVTHTPEEFPLDQWQAWASPVWMDIRQTHVLDYQDAKGNRDERHICPLQLDVIERAIRLWSRPGDLVFDPFNGIGSTGHEALRLGRRYIGSELKDTYCQWAAKMLGIAQREVGAPSLFGSEPSQ